LAGALQLLGKPAECLLLVIHGNKERVVMLRDADAARWQGWQTGVPAAIAVPRKTGCKKSNDEGREQEEDPLFNTAKREHVDGVQVRTP
jgi:hypothetical protein